MKNQKLSNAILINVVLGLIVLLWLVPVIGIFASSSHTSSSHKRAKLLYALGFLVPEANTSADLCNLVPLLSSFNFNAIFEVYRLRISELCTCLF